ncbi:MAG TPA: hypothetical protein VGC74_09835 [Stenotrophomonas sp.]|jgi:hypothetical protein
MTYSKALSGTDRTASRDTTNEHNASGASGLHRSEHWLAPDLIHRSALSAPPVELSHYVIDIDGEIGFWHLHYKRSAIRHRNVLPFSDYVPAFKLGLSLFLQCHGHAIEALNESVLASTYDRVRSASRVEWTEARHAIHAAFLRLQMRWKEAALIKMRSQNPAGRDAARPSPEVHHLHTLGATRRSEDPQKSP